MKLRHASLGLLAAIGIATAIDVSAASAVYRCGNVYSERPCSDGRAVEVGDARTPEQRVDAARVAAEERRRAAAFERDRHAREAAAPRSAARLDRPVSAASTSPVSPPRRKPARRMRGGQVDSENFVAFDTAAPRKKRAD